jgi:hypothetical protein
MSENKSEQVNVRMTPTLKSAAEEAAEAEHRTLTNLIEKLLTDYLRKHGYLKTSSK